MADVKAVADTPVRVTVTVIYAAVVLCLGFFASAFLSNAVGARPWGISFWFQLACFAAIGGMIYHRFLHPVFWGEFSGNTGDEPNR